MSPGPSGAMRTYVRALEAASRREEVAVSRCATPDPGAQVLDSLGYAYHGKNIATIRKWAGRWGISTAHLTDHRGQPYSGRRYSDAELAEAVAASYSWAETLRRLGYCPTGGNWKLAKKRARELGDLDDHFDPYAASRRAQSRRPFAARGDHGRGLRRYSRSHLKRRLYEEGLKERRCELCGQDEIWHGGGSA